MRDPYTVLGVPKNASDEEIKKSYRSLAKKYHPDLNPGNKDVEKRFKELTQAYDILGDAAKRKKFDAGHMDAEGNDRSPFHRGGAYNRKSGGGGGFDPFKDLNPEDIFADLFNMGKRNKGGRGDSGRGSFEDELNKANKAQGADMQYTLRVTFIEAARGAKRRISIGDGTKAMDVTIPQGTTNGQILRLKGQGRPSPGGGAPGDAYIEIQIDPDPIFEAKGINIFMDLPVTVYEAVLGATVNVPTIDGKVAISIPKNSNADTSLRLKGKGLLDQKNKIRGDQYVKLKIVLPEKIDKKLKEFSEEWAEDAPYNVRRNLEK